MTLVLINRGSRSSNNPIEATLKGEFEPNIDADRLPFRDPSWSRHEKDQQDSVNWKDLVCNPTILLKAREVECTSLEDTVSLCLFLIASFSFVSPVDVLLGVGKHRRN